MKLNRNAWWVQKLGAPDNWCLLAWAILWRLAVAVGTACIVYFYLSWWIIGSWEILRYFAGAEETSKGWMMLGSVMNVITVYIIAVVVCINSKKIAKFISKHCPKIEYEG